MVINARDFNAPLLPSNLRGGVGYHRRSRCLEEESDTTAGVDKRSDNSAGGWHARYLTPPLRLEGGAVGYYRRSR